MTEEELKRQKKDEMKRGLYEVLTSGYFDKNEVKREVFVDLMTIKMLLIDKGYIGQKEFDCVRSRVEKQVTEEIQEQIKAMEQSNPKESATLDMLASLFSSSGTTPSAGDVV